MCQFLHIDSMRFKDNQNRNSFTDKFVNTNNTNDSHIKTESNDYTSNIENTKLFICD